MTDKNIKRTCNICNQMMHGGIKGFIEHGENHHPDHYLSGSKNGHNIKFVEKNFFCPLDDSWYSSRQHMARTIKKYGWTNEKYYLTYGKEFLSEQWNKNEYDPVLGNGRNHDKCLQCNKTTSFLNMKWEYNAFCCLSCSVNWSNENTNRSGRAQETQKQRLIENPDHNLRPTQHRYWVLRGHTDEEATLLVSERQKTFSLNIAIKKYGKIEGKKRWMERQRKWQNTLRESGAKCGYSRSSMLLFDNVDIHFGNLRYGKYEKQLRCNDMIVRVDCYNPTNKKVIEFYGDYWHANPIKYDGDYIINKKTGRTAKEIWVKDDKRIKQINQKGHDVLIVWEKEFIDNPEETIQKCINWLL